MLRVVSGMLSRLRLRHSTNGKHTENKCYGKKLADRNIHRSAFQIN